MKRLRIATYILSAAAIATLTFACAGDDGVQGSQPTVAHDTFIMLDGISLPAEAQTRADEGADKYRNSLPEGSNVGVYIYDHTGVDISQSQVKEGDSFVSALWIYKTDAPDANDGNKMPISLNMTNPSHKLNPRYPYYKVDGVDEPCPSVNIFGVYPIQPEHTPEQPAYTFTVKQNQTVADNVSASDLISSGVLQKVFEDFNGKTENLPMYHQMARVKVVFTPKAGSDLTADNMPTNFDVQNVYHTVTVDPHAAYVDPAGVNTTGITLYESAGQYTTGNDALKGSTDQAFLLPPQTITAGTNLLKFDIKAGNNTVTPASDFKGINGATFVVPSGGITLQAGHSYTINVTVDVDFITLTGTITGWVAASADFYGNTGDEPYEQKGQHVL